MRKRKKKQQSTGKDNMQVTIAVMDRQEHQNHGAVAVLLQLLPAANNKIN